MLRRLLGPPEAEVVIKYNLGVAVIAALGLAIKLELGACGFAVAAVAVFAALTASLRHPASAWLGIGVGALGLSLPGALVGGAIAIRISDSAVPAGLVIGAAAGIAGGAWLYAHYARVLQGKVPPPE